MSDKNVDRIYGDIAEQKKAAKEGVINSLVPFVHGVVMDQHGLDFNCP